MRIITLILFCIFSVTAIGYADTVFMNDGDKLKGLIVDEYVDRITLSTVDGEKDIFRKDISRIEYDTPEQNFMQLGRAYEDRGWYDKAAFYYKKAMESSPGYGEAREAYIAAHSKLWRQEEKATHREVERQNVVADWRKNRNRNEIATPRDKDLLLQDTLGISLIEKDGIFSIDKVLPDSSAHNAGIKKEDILAGIWGRLIRYSKMEDIVEELLGPKYSEVRIIIERKIAARINEEGSDIYKTFGLVLGFEYEGLTVKDVIEGSKAQSEGFEKGDLVVTINNNATRYLPLDSVIALINSAESDKEMIFNVRRNINLRRMGPR